MDNKVTWLSLAALAALSPASPTQIVPRSKKKMPLTPEEEDKLKNLSGKNKKRFVRDLRLKYRENK